MTTNLPFKTFRCGNVQSAIWNNKRTLEDGSEVEFKTVSLSRSYKKRGESTWRNEVINLRRNDLQKILLVTQKAHEELLLHHEDGSEEE